MDSGIRMDYAAASEKARIVEADAAEIQNILNSLVEDVNSNVNNTSVWTGDSAQKFKNAWENCAENFHSFVEHIQTVQAKIDAAATTTRTFDQQ